MECPNCKHTTGNSALLQCSHCGEAFERGLFEEYQHLQYLAGWLGDRPEISQDLKRQLLALVGKKQTVLRGQLLPKVAEREKPIEPKPSPASIEEKKPTTEKAVSAPVVQTKAELVPLPTPITKPAPVPVAVSKPKPAPRKPAVPPKPPRPPIDWRKVIVEAATSGALLRALLYLGAFMIVVSATVLVIRFWDQFHPIIQLLFIASVPLSFYAGGWALRFYLKLVQAGTVLTGIGALLVVVDFGAIYQLGGIGQNNGPLYWLLVSIFCTMLYTFTAWQLEGEFFDYLPLIGATSVFFTFTRFLQLGMEWSIVSVTASGTLMTLLASTKWKANNPLHDFARASRYLSQILIPASVFYIVFSPGMPPIGQMLSFLFATAGYMVLAWQFPSFIFAYAALGTSVGTVIFAMVVGDIPFEWYSSTASLLAFAYLLISQLVQEWKINPSIVQKYSAALSTTGLILLSVGAVGGFVTSLSSDTWAGIIAMIIASLDLILCAYLFKKSRYTLLASGTFIVPVSMAAIELLKSLHVQVPAAIAWLTVTWGALAIFYIILGAVLNKFEKHNRWLYEWAHFLTFIALFCLPFSYLIDPTNWAKVPSLLSLGTCILVYLLSFVLQDSGRHSSLLAISSWLPYGLGKSIFLWPIAVLIPIWCAIAWGRINFTNPWVGAILSVLGIIYIGLGQALSRRAKEYRLPFHSLTYILGISGIFIATPDYYALFVTLSITVLSVGILAYLYNRVIETVVASLLFIWPFQLLMNILNVTQHVQTLLHALLASSVYIPVAIYLDKFQKSREHYHHFPVFSVGYALMAFATIESLLLSDSNQYIPWIGVAISLVGTALFTFSASYFRKSKLSFLWASASILTFTIAYGQALTLFNIPSAYIALAWVGLALFYVVAERTVFLRPQRQANELQNMFRAPVIVSASILAVLGLSLTLPLTISTFIGVYSDGILPAILAQVAVVLLAVISARLYKQGWQLFFEPFIAILPATLFFISYGEQIFGQDLTITQYALIWASLGIIHVFAGFLVDHAKVRYAHGLYFGGYVLLSSAVLWTIFDRPILVWTLGTWILTSSTSALLVHLRRHQTWDDLLHLLFGSTQGVMPTIIRNTFQWLAAWAFPIWCVLFLSEINISENFLWLGLVLPSLAYLGLTLWLRYVDASYTAPWNSAAQVYTVIALLISAPVTLSYLTGNFLDNNSIPAIISLQASAVLFYAISSWIFKERGFAHVAAWLSISVFSIAWKFYGDVSTSIMFVMPWLVWSAILLLVGYTLDKNKVRYSHGPYLAGYALMSFALEVSTQSRLINIYALAVTILFALLSHIIVHFGRHHTFEDFIQSIWKNAADITGQIASTVFLFFASYATPVLVVYILDYNNFHLAWCGMSLTIMAPLYIAIGLIAGKAKSKGKLNLLPTWALYSAGYALTVIGPILAFEDQLLGTYALILNVIVYAASAYIFRQPVWLYLSTILTPIIALLLLNQADRLESAWVAWIFILLAYLYLGIGQFFDRMKKSSDIHSFALPFYVPGYTLSVFALVISGNDKPLAIQIYSAVVILYALSGWLFREALFIYPAAWLAVVPYYLTITVTSLDARLYGLAWLPLIMAYIAIGRIFFHKKSLASVEKGIFALAEWISHPAVPLYLMAYALSVGMIWLSFSDPLALTLALLAGMTIYMTSAILFLTPEWIYAGLIAAHLTVLAYFAIDPQGGEPYLLSYPFHALTWLIALVGLGLSRWITVAVPSVARSRGESSADDKSAMSWLDHLLDHPWARPFFLFAVVDIFFWQFVALNSYETTITLAIGHAIMLALFSIVWMAGSLVYGAIFFGLLATGTSMTYAQVSFGNAMAFFGGIGFGLYLLAHVFKPISSWFRPLRVWLTPLAYSSIFLATTAMIVNLPFVFTYITANAVSLAFAGTLYITIAYRERQYLLGYLGMALLEIAWGLLLYTNEIRQPQLYAIPAGLYFLGIAYLEMQGNRKGYAVAIEILGLGVLLVTSFAQSLNDQTGLIYFILLMIEALFVIWWGVLQKRKMPFFTGIGASAINIAAQVIILISVHDIHRVNRWLVAFGAGLIITAIAVIAELKREQLRARSRQLTEMLESWE